MDFSLNVDPSATFAASQSSREYLTRHDFDLSEDLPFLSDPGRTLTIEPHQLTDMSDSPSPSPSPSGMSYSSASSSPRPRSKKSKAQHSHDEQGENHAKRHQTKLACSWCRKLSKKCDTQRPCGRCIQFDRCSECVDAPPRKPRAKGVDRGTYKKTRDLAVINYQEAVIRREAYVAKMERKGKRLEVGLTADQILEATRKEEARNKEAIEANVGEQDKENMEEVFQDIPQPILGNFLQGGSPFAGPLEDLFTCSASPEPEEPVYVPRLASSASSTPSSPEESLFDISSPRDSVTDYDESDLVNWEWHTIDKFPNIMKLVAAAQEQETETELHRFWAEEIMA